MLFDYDDANVESIFAYARRLENMTFLDILNEYEQSIQKYYVNPKDRNSKPIDAIKYKIPNINSRGQLGNLLEACYFGYKPNGIQDADFPKVGLELKLTPLDTKKNGDFRAGERLVITTISYKEPIESDFYKSHVWKKIKLILLVHYLRDKSKERKDYELKFVNLFTPPQNDLTIIIQDYLKIIKKIQNGKAHELSEGDTNYLGACTKGQKAKTSIVNQYYGNHIPARKRAFCFKQPYMNFVLNEYVLKKNVPCESIIQNNHLTSNDTFENQLIGLINKYSGMTEHNLMQQFNIENENTNAKQKLSLLAYRMLGIKSNKAEELIKANIVIKTIRINKNKKIKESMSFPKMVFKKFINESFEESDFCRYFEETKFLFVIYIEKNNQYVLDKAQLWNMPATDLYGDAQNGWLAIQNKIKNGVTFTIQGNRVLNDLPNKNDNRIIHIRPHTTKSAYKLHNGFEKGDLSKDADQLPNGEWMTIQCLWLNNDYVLSQLK